MTSSLAVRLDSDGDVLLAGPAVRALAADGPVDLLVSPAGEQAAGLLPGVRRTHVFSAPWSGYRPPPLDRAALARLATDLSARRYDRGVILVSHHQSPLPAALVLRAAGVGFLAADCEDYPGSLLDLRHRRAPARHEVEAALDLVRALGAPLPEGDDARLAVREPLPDVTDLVPDRPFVVVHPGAAVPARAPTADHAAAIVAALVADGLRVVVTGASAEGALAAQVAGGHGISVAGRTSYARLAAVLRAARAVVVGNTGPAHLAAAVGTPVVSLFSPVVPVELWRPWRVRSVVLGDQTAACAGTRARRCPVVGHPCLSGVTPGFVVEAVHSVIRRSGR
ncbi:glycosyltransferase family 9 protein [Xylanimonas protaetiae]|uniref:Glycosyltransferase family 9 protein n=1 Tax=Xylanimonas protaetiae TaxID=2509457 RepID=A0A4P6F612_9MICO|nr:glycosyltransferase family 9 protein [Xylanimonas protaetiae]QAY71172.1 glycosyltransferase family 9 protein [Xylanimonas protaetiae]